MDSLEQIKNKLGGKILKAEVKNPKRIYIDIGKQDITEAAAFLYRDLDFRYMVVTGIDRRDGIELLYHFAEDSEGKVYSLRVLLSDKNAPSIESLVPVIKGISWIEREIHELLGVDFAGHPNLKHLLLSDDWPEGKYPLRQDQNRDQIKDYEKK
ncbi:MAG: NADH-quinone oxidoreductase subunit C [Elusimicrobiota bacterium]